MFLQIKKTTKETLKVSWGGEEEAVHYSRIFVFRRGVLEPNPRKKGGLNVLREAYILGSSGVTAFPVTSTVVIAPANHVEKVHFVG
jgi:hypothetical protein